MGVGIIRTAWSGTSGGPGVTQLAIDEPDGIFATEAGVQTCVNAVRAFWSSIASHLPNELVLTVQPTVDWYQIADGELIGSITAPTAPASVSGTDTGNYAAASGYKVNLHTGAIRDGRRVRGSIYVVPAASISMTNTGTIAASIRTAANTAAMTMRTGINASNLIWCVYSRERKATALKPYRAGAVTPITVAEVGEKTAIMRGRRD